MQHSVFIIVITTITTATAAAAHTVNDIKQTWGNNNYLPALITVIKTRGGDY